LLGFVAGWSLYVGEWIALSAFPKAFFNYFSALVDAPSSWEMPVKLTLVGFVTAINFVGVRQGARTNDALTLAKLVPLAVLAALGLVYLFAHWGDASSHLQPLAPVGWGGLGDAVLPIFWAYAGFELAVLPAAEVRSPARTLPRGLILGVAIATIFYLLVSLSVVVALPWQDVAASTHPLASAMDSILTALSIPGDAGARFMSLGGLVSIAGVFLVFMLGLARLSYALAADGILPRAFTSIHGRFGTPYVGLLFQAVSAIVFSTIFDLRALLSTAVFFLSICYLLTALSAIRLVGSHPAQALHLPGLRLLLVISAASSAYLIAQASPAQFVVGIAVIVLGLLMFGLRRLRQRTLGPSVASEQTPRHTPADDEHHIHAWLHRSARRR
jgi:amino acid transporter